MRSAKTAPTLSTTAALWLAVSLALIMALHATHLPPWISALFAAAAVWRWLMATRGFAPLSRGVLVPLTLLVSAGVFLQGGTLLGREVGVSLLAAMAALKLLEARTVRDGAVLTSLGLLLLMAVLLYTQDLLTAAAVIFALSLLLVAQLAVHSHAATFAPKPALRLIGRMLLQSLPIMLVLFILFPRIPGPLWSLPRDAHTGRSGLSESMAPGSISQLIQSPAVAFRVQFNGAAPEVAQMYWRGPVLENFDGRTWTRGSEKMVSERPYELLSKRIEYRVMLEPHGLRSLFALDLPATESGLTESYELKRSDPVHERMLYSMTSFLDFRTPPVGSAERSRNLALPNSGNGRARALALSWRAQQQGDANVARHALAWFSSEAFYYTLQPPLLGAEIVDDFLFNTRRGFCEHYASSFVFLMRAAGIPARVVTGYQGGEANGGYTIVRQSDAHAWAEIWLPERGWTRIDPTAAVAPQRVEQGLHAAIEDADELPFLARRSGSFWRAATLAWDRVNNAWNIGVLAYGPERQKEFLSRLGFGRVDWQQMVIAMFAALTIILLIGLLFAQRKMRKKIDPIALAYHRFCDKLARRGLVRAQHEGPLQFTQRAAREHHDVGSHFIQIGNLYANLRYGAAQPVQVDELRRLVDALNF